MTNTRDKLNEATFFLEEMKGRASDTNGFRYMLTAFLSANRSITQIMQKEFSKVSGFTGWYDLKQEEITRNPTLKYLHRQRVITYHIRPILLQPTDVTGQNTNSISANIIINGTSASIIISGTGGSVGVVGSGAILPEIEPTVTDIKYYFDDIAIKDKDVITVCQEGVDIIKNIVNECERRFGEALS